MTIMDFFYDSCLVLLEFLGVFFGILFAVIAISVVFVIIFDDSNKESEESK